MKAVIHVDLTMTQAEEAKKILEDACRKLQAASLIKDFHFEIETPDGPVTEKCILADGKVVA